ncbi:MAG: hypothetical protein QM680_06355 [Luteolibacter sp.]
MARPRMTPAYLIACGIAALTLQSASAHQFWIERADDKFIVRFGEAGSNGEKPEYEKSPGVLDKLQGVSAWSMFPAKSGSDPELLKAKPQGDGFLIEEVPSKLPLLAQTTFPVRKRAAAEGKPASASFTTAFARFQPAGAEATPTTTLDLVPSEKGKATLYFKGKPLAAGKVTLFGSSAKPVSLQADEQGAVTIPADAKGDVLLWAYHSEPAEGVYLGSSYNSLGYMVTLSYKFND